MKQNKKITSAYKQACEEPITKEKEDTDTSPCSDNVFIENVSCDNVDESLAEKNILFIEDEDDHPGSALHAKKMLLNMATNGAKEITIFINSQGGSSTVFFSLHDIIIFIRKTYGCKVVIIVNGIAASAAALVLQAADVRCATRNSFIMLHETSFMYGGKTAEFRDYFKVVGKLQDRVLKIWASRMGMKAKELYELLENKDVYFDSNQSKKLGLIDIII